MEKLAQMALLADFYGPLLTEKQRNVWELYYAQDLSLVEIAESEHISRQAVYDLLKRTEKILRGYEEKLRLIQRFVMEKRKISNLKNMLEEFDEADFFNSDAWKRHQIIASKIDDIFQDI